jgi:hypothetical protein
MRSSLQLALLIFCGLLLSSCEFNCSVGKTKVPAENGKTVTSSTVEKNGTTLTNNIELTAKGVKIKKATLLLPDNTQVSDDNMVKLNQKIKMVLFIENGWTLKEGKNYVGASEKIVSSSGQVIVDAEDLFTDYTTSGIDPEDAKLISLSAVITQESGSSSYYEVTFRVWDKAGDAEITGSYKFYLKH